RRHTRCLSDWSSDVCSSDLRSEAFAFGIAATPGHAQQHPEQRLQRPARSHLRRPPGPMDLLPELRREKLSQGFLEGNNCLLLLRSEERRVGKEGREGSRRER